MNLGHETARSLGAAAFEPFSDQTAGTDRDLRLLILIAKPLFSQIRPIYSFDPFALVTLALLDVGHRKSHRKYKRNQAGCHPLPSNSGQEDRGNQKGAKTERASRVVLGEDEPGRHNPDHSRNNHCPQIEWTLSYSYQVGRQKKQCEKLGHL